MSEELVYSELSKGNQQQIRKEMLRQAELILADMHQSKAQLRAAVRTMVDAALAKERRA